MSGQGRDRGPVIHLEARLVGPLPFGQVLLCGFSGGPVFSLIGSESGVYAAVQLGIAVQYLDAIQISPRLVHAACFLSELLPQSLSFPSKHRLFPPRESGRFALTSLSDLRSFAERDEGRVTGSFSADLAFQFCGLTPCARIEGCDDFALFGTPCSKGSSLVAPKRRIGGSGTPATRGCLNTTWNSCCLGFLEGMQHLALPFFLSLQLMGVLCLIHLLLRTLDGRTSPLGKTCLFFCDWVPRRLVLALGSVGASGRTDCALCLDWRRIDISRKQARRSRPAGNTPRKGFFSGCHRNSSQGRAAGWLPSPWPSLPKRVKPTPPLFGILPLVVLLSSTAHPVSAMTAPHAADVLSEPDELPETPSPLVPSVTGCNDIQLPWLRVAVSDSPHVHELPTEDPRTLDNDPDKWLGVYVHTPLYCTVTAAVRPNRSARAHGLIDAIHDHVGGVPHEPFSAVVPIMPQRFPGFASFLRMPRVLRQEGEVQSTAIIVDLTRVGGNYFAEVVPKCLAYAELEARILSWSETGSTRPRFFVGCKSSPCPQGAPVTFFTGAVLTVAWTDQVDIFRGTLEDLLADEANWGPISQMPRTPSVQGTLVQYHGDSYFMSSQSLEGKGLAAAVADAYSLDLHDITTCGFPFSDFEYKGFRCSLLFCVFDLPCIGQDSLQAQRRDLFTLCDGRALGVVPSILHTCHPVIHLPSLAARMKLHLPLAMRLNAAGGRRFFDEVFLEGNSAIFLFASHESSFSDGASDAEVASSDVAQAEGEQHPVPNNPVTSWSAPDDSVPPAWRRRQTVFSAEATQIASADLGEAPGNNISEDAGIIGVALFAPHYQTEHIAVHLAPGEGRHEVISRTRAAALRIPVAHLECSALIEPVPYEGFAAVMVFSRVLEFNDNVAVLIDLSDVGGKRFPATLPSTLQFAAWERYIRSMISVPVPQSCTFVGHSDQPAGPGGDLTLCSGDLIVVYELGFVERSCQRHDQFFADRWEWRDPDRIPRHDRASGVCLLTAEDRWFLHIRNFPGCTLLQAAEQCLGASAGSITLGSARFAAIDDLCLQGEPCRGVIFACHTPPPAPSPPAASVRDDHFIFLDFRQVGCRPFGMYQAGDCWSIHSLLARFPFRLPAEYALGIEGGRQEGDYLFAISGTTLKFRLIFAGWAHLPDTDVPAPGALPDSGADGDEGPDVHNAPVPGVVALPCTASEPQNRGSRSRSRSPRRSAASNNPHDSSGFYHLQLLCSKVVGTATRAKDNRCLSLARKPGFDVDIGPVNPWCHQRAAASSLMRPLLFRLEAMHAPALQLSSGFSGGGKLFPQPEGRIRRVKPVVCKLLNEPNPQRGPDRTALAVLRALAPHFGQAWRYIPPDDAERILEAPSEADSEVVSDVQSQCNLHFAIAKPGYWLERISVTTFLPATIDEVIDLVQAARAEEYFQFFPFLRAVHPQPCPGSGFLLACPIWQPDALLICLDTSLIDGRIFAAESPPYISRHQLIALADLPGGLDLHVHVALDSEPLDNDLQLHVAAGMRICFVPIGEHFQYAPPLGQALLEPSSWNDSDTVPYPGQRDAYCLVGARDTVLCLQESLSPMTYRQHIARCVGIPDARLRLFPSTPRVLDAAIHGLPCSTVIHMRKLTRLRGVVCVPSSWTPDPSVRAGICFSRRLTTLRALASTIYFGPRLEDGALGSEERYLDSVRGLLDQGMFWKFFTPGLMS